MTYSRTPHQTPDQFVYFLLDWCADKKYQQDLALNINTDVGNHGILDCRWLLLLTHVNLVGVETLVWDIYWAIYNTTILEFGRYLFFLFYTERARTWTLDLHGA